MKKEQDAWQHRSARMRCATCIYFVAKSDVALETFGRLGRCRRHAPTLAGWPAVHEVDWCGDHKLDETKVK